MDGKPKGSKIGIIPTTEYFAKTSPFSKQDSFTTFFSENVDNADVNSIGDNKMIMTSNLFNKNIKEFNEKRTKVYDNRGKQINSLFEYKVNGTLFFFILSRRRKKF